MLDPAGGPWLFPGERGRHKNRHTLSGQIAGTTEKELGVRLSAHQFRHVAGHLFLQANPGGHEVVRSLLGHRSIETTLKFYAGMETAAAVRHYDEVILGLRDGTPQAVRKAR